VGLADGAGGRDLPALDLTARNHRQLRLGGIAVDPCAGAAAVGQGIEHRAGLPVGPEGVGGGAWGVGVGHGAAGGVRRFLWENRIFASNKSEKGIPVMTPRTTAEVVTAL